MKPSTTPNKLGAAQRQRFKQQAIPRPPAALILSTPVHLIAFGFGSGLARHAPGTWGTLAAVPIFLLASALPFYAYAALCLALFVLGCWACGESGRLLQVEDYPGFVFDEIVGFLLAAAPLVAWFGFWAPGVWIGLPIAFALFRVFDIVKPWPIAWFDRQVHGGLGVMLDDVLAGLFVALIGAGALWLLRGAPLI
jgi:phosphatidylglycerophosphatase A